MQVVKYFGTHVTEGSHEAEHPFLADAAWTQNSLDVWLTQEWLADNFSYPFLGCCFTNVYS